MPKEENDYVTKIGYQLHQMSTWFHMGNGSTPPSGVHYAGAFANKSIDFNLMVLGGATFSGNTKATNLIRNRFRTTQSLNFNHPQNMLATVKPNAGEVVQYDYTNTFNGQPAIVLLTGRTITFTFAKTPLFVSSGGNQENVDVFSVYSNVLDDVTDKETGSFDFKSDHEIEETTNLDSGFSIELAYNGYTKNIDINGPMHDRYHYNGNDTSTISSRLKALNITVNTNTSSNKYDYTLTITNGLVATIELWSPQITTNYGSYYPYSAMWGDE